MSAEENLDWTCANFSKWSAMRRKTSTSAPLDSPARTILMYKSEKTLGCWAIASERLLPSMTSWRNSLLTSEEMPLDSRWTMLLRETVNGMPGFRRLDHH